MQKNFVKYKESYRNPLGAKIKNNLLVNVLLE